MNTYDLTNTEAELQSLLQEVNQTHVPVRIVGENVAAVMLSADDWRAVEETIYINSFRGLADSILSASKEPVEDCLPVGEADW
jgi:prevent-host-death family protein